MIKRLLLSLFFLSIVSSATAQISPCIATTDSSVNVRQEPNTTAPVLGLVISTNPVEVIGANNEGWLQVQRSDFGTGWLAAEFVILSGDCDVLDRNPFLVPLNLEGAQILFFNADGYLSAMDAEGGNMRQLAAQRSAPVPLWSPDGTRFVFTADSTGMGTDIYIVNADGSGFRNLTDDHAHNFRPQWSPDGTMIAFESMRDAPEVIEPPLLEVNFRYIYVINVDDEVPESRRLIAPRPEPPQYYNSTELLQDWMHDGRILFISQRDNLDDGFFRDQLYSIDPVTDELINLTELAGSGIGEGELITLFEAVASPDGTQIVFLMKESETVTHNIYVMNNDGTNLRQLTSGTRYHYGLVWSPDGTQIAFVADDVITDDYQWDIYVVNLDQSGEINLTPNMPGYDLKPYWSPDGTRIAFNSDRNGDTDIFLINADGSDLRQLTTTDGNETLAGWLPSSER